MRLCRLAWLLFCVRGGQPGAGRHRQGAPGSVATCLGRAVSLAICHVQSNLQCCHAHDPRTCTAALTWPWFPVSR